MKPVAVSQRIDTVPGYGERRDALDQRLSAFLLAGGCLPVPVPNDLSTGDARALDAWLAAIQPAGIVLSGGNDIGTRPERDATEARLLAHAAAQRLPLLGICRGMQMLAHRAGTALIPVAGHVASRHRLEGIIARETNSYHRLALSDCPPEYEILARSADGVIEAIRHIELPWEGWMWHPERDPALHRQDIERLKALFQ